METCASTVDGGCNTSNECLSQSPVKRQDASSSHDHQWNIQVHAIEDATCKLDRHTNFREPYGIYRKVMTHRSASTLSWLYSSCELILETPLACNLLPYIRHLLAPVPADRNSKRNAIMTFMDLHGFSLSQNFFRNTAFSSAISLFSLEIG